MRILGQINLPDFLERVRFADLLDILLVAALIYVAISWLRSGASRTVVVIITAMVTLFVLAQALSMYLTQQLLEAFFAVFVVTFVVLFQGEIRRELDRLAAQGIAWRRRRRNKAGAVPAAIGTVASVAERLARERTGALMVLRGREPIGNLVEGGTGLDGEVSEALLCSLFNPKAPGHDGAVLIDGDRLTRFSAHLPLSSNLAVLGERGTRHAAALGLAERSDALTVVVSEERGQVSVAEGGRLQPLVDPRELRTRLEAFWRDRHTTQPTRPAGRRAQWKEAGTVAASVALAVVFWLLLAYQGEVAYRSRVVPIEFRNPPAALALQDPPTEVRVTLAGSPPALRRLEAEPLVLQLDLSRLQAGENELVVTEDRLVNLPSGVSLVSADPPTVRVVARPAERRPPQPTPPQ